MIYYIADMHFGHKNVLRFDNRPFADTELMDEVLIHNWNERVTDEDTVYVLGDAFWKNEESSVKIIQRLNGHKHLIRGNHDRVHGRLRFHWESIEQYSIMKMTPLKKQSKNEQRKYYSSKRGSWNGVSPITRIVQSRRVYDRNRIKREDRRAAGE